MKSLLLKLAFLFINIIAVQSLYAQYKVQGTIYDSSRTYPLEAVSVMSTSGKGTITNATGFYQIDVSEKDSIWFSYLGKPTIKYPVAKMLDPHQFDLALRVPVNVLKEVTVRPRNYRLDSLQNRQDYAKVFNYQKPNLGTMTSIGAGGVGFDIDEIIRAFQFRKNKSMMRFQQRLIQQEQDKYVDHRFNKALVRRLTGLDGEKLDQFMTAYRPSYEFAVLTNDYDFQSYIKESSKKFKSGTPF
ncbi:hypothetical protein [Flavisolibacter tropicus]|uniref:hypothetical protein n=1 Tax=Flavisolibacter tropicus TaxID=1492898 RepID=UPI0009EE7305|nr:hypothetical protein [Flavisolibacter tropicus]